MSDQLKPCPFCGSTDIRISVTRRYVSIWCGVCGCQITRGVLGRPCNSLAEAEQFYSAEAQEAWNRRTDND